MFIALLAVILKPKYRYNRIFVIITNNTTI